MRLFPKVSLWVVAMDTNGRSQMQQVLQHSCPKVALLLFSVLTRKTQRVQPECFQGSSWRPNCRWGSMPLMGGSELLKQVCRNLFSLRGLMLDGL